MKLYEKLAEKWCARAWKDSAKSEELLGKLVNSAKKDGVNTHILDGTDPRMMTAYSPGNPWPTAPIFSGKNGNIFVEPHLNNPGIYAHEYGHAKDLVIDRSKGMSDFLIRLDGIHRAVLTQAGAAVGAGMQLSDDERVRTAGLGIAGISALPLLRTELAASARGYKMLRNLGASRNQALTSFSGVPTYILGSAIPVAAVGGAHWAYDKLSGNGHREKSAAAVRASCGFL